MLEGSDPTLKAEFERIKSDLNERKQMLNDRMEVSQSIRSFELLQHELKWIQERAKIEAEQLREEEKQELAGLVTYLHEELNQIRRSLDERVQKIDLYDRKTLNILKFVDQELKLGNVRGEDEK